VELKPNEKDSLESINIFQLRNMAAFTSINSVIDQATGEFKRPAAQFRNFISSQPDSKFQPEKGRYHLYVSYACPWG
jgi:putative glutathione S-transferase